MPGLTIIGSGRYLPGKPVTNDDLARVMDTSDAWIRPRSGIAQPHFVAVRQSLGVLAEKVPSNIARHGNTSAGTIQILLDALVREGRVRAGRLVCRLGLGAELNWGVVLLRM